MCVTDKGAEVTGMLLARLALGLVPEDVVAAHAKCDLAPSIKPSGSGLRPLQVGSVCRRIGMTSIAKLVKQSMQEAVGPDQLA